MRINNNIESLNAWRTLANTNIGIGKSLEKLSSGYRINRASDDAAGLAISETMRAQIKGLNRAMQNAQDGISMIQTAEGALNETQSILQRMRELAVQASSETLSNTDRTKIDAEVDQLVTEIGRIATDTKFNGTKVLSTNTITVTIGADAGQVMNITTSTATAAALSVSAVDTSTLTGASTAIAKIDIGLAKVSSIRAGLGAFQNRLEHTIANLGVAAENLTASESRIRDVDMASEMMTFTRLQILMQAGTAMLAQSNAKPQSVLQLLG